MQQERIDAELVDWLRAYPHLGVTVALPEIRGPMLPDDSTTARTGFWLPETRKGLVRCKPEMS